MLEEQKQQPNLIGKEEATLLREAISSVYKNHCSKMIGEKTILKRIYRIRNATDSYELVLNFDKKRI
jgi:hypothetical protein